MKVANKIDKKEQAMGLKLTFGDYVITSTEPSQYTVTIKDNKQCYFPSLEMAAQYIKKDIALKSGYITTIEQLEEAFNHADTLVMDALGKLPF